MCAVWYAFGMGVLYIFLKVLTPGLIKQLTWGRSVPSGLCVFLGIVATMTKRKKSREQNTFDYTVLVRETTEASALLSLLLGFSGCGRFRNQLPFGARDTSTA